MKNALNRLSTMCDFATGNVKKKTDIYGFETESLHLKKKPYVMKGSSKQGSVRIVCPDDIYEYM